MNVLAHAMLYAMIEWNVNGKTIVEEQVTIHNVNAWICLEMGKESFSNVVGLGLETRTSLYLVVHHQLKTSCEKNTRRLGKVVFS